MVVGELQRALVAFGMSDVRRTRRAAHWLVVRGSMSQVGAKVGADKIRPSSFRKMRQ